MEIKDLSWNENIYKRFNNPLLPRSIRGIIVGKSGCGKTTLLLNLRLRPDWLDYDNLFLFGKSLFQTEYKILKAAFEEGLPKEYILRLFNMRDEIQNSQILPTLVVKEWVKSINNESNLKCNFFEQNYFKLPRQTIRENANFMCLFPQDLKNLNHIYNDHVGDDMTKEEFRNFCKKCWDKSHGFAVIDLTSKKDAGKYRQGFDNFFIPKLK